MITARPFVISKFAMTLDGKLATHTGHSKWITGEKARLNVHELRNEIDAILVGVGTVIADNPSLTTRLPEGGGKNPTRVILDSQLRTPLDATILKTEEAKTIIVTKAGVDAKLVKLYEDKGVSFLYVSHNQGLNLQEMLEKLYHQDGNGRGGDGEQIHRYPFR